MLKGDPHCFNESARADVVARRYKSDLTPEQKEALLEVLRAKSHPQITPEIRRELVHSIARGEQLEEPVGESLEMELL